MAERADAAPSPLPDRCRECGGELIVGRLALPLLGSAKFAYSLRGRSIEAGIVSRMCAECGTISLVVADPALIRRAAAADRAASTGRRRP